MATLKRITKDAMVLYQRFGHFDEQLVSFYSVAFGTPYICQDNYIMYFDKFGKILYLSLFELKGKGDKIHCIETAVKRFGPERIVITSPEKLEGDIVGFNCIEIDFDRDYQIYLPGFDESLKGHDYKHLRYRVHNAVKRGYYLEVGKRMTPAHYHLIARHEAEKKCAWWDMQLYLSLKDYLKGFSSPLLFNIFSNKTLIGFDLIAFLNDVMTTPLGFYPTRVDHPSLADFILFKEIVYAKENGYTWLDLGWACNPGVESFKRKWMAEPRFDIWILEYMKDQPEPQPQTGFSPLKE